MLKWLWSNEVIFFSLNWGSFLASCVSLWTFIFCHMDLSQITSPTLFWCTFPSAAAPSQIYLILTMVTCVCVWCCSATWGLLVVTCWPVSPLLGLRLLIYVKAAYVWCYYINCFRGNRSWIGFLHWQILWQLACINTVHTQWFLFFFCFFFNI